LGTLVSVIVVTYNSSKFIKETLNSIAAQTWTELELIITDDFSKDNTVDICQRWLMEHKGRFILSQLITHQKNTGVTANRNRGLSAARGEWIKFCAGDDALLPNCIKDNLQYISQNQDIKILFSYCRMYSEHFTEDCFTGLNPSVYPSHIISDDITVEEQYKLLLVSNRIPFTPTVFCHHDTLKVYGNIDERYSFSEDYLLWLILTKNGIKLFFVEKETVKYRIHDASLSKQVKEYIVNPVYYKTEASIKKYSYPFIPWDVRLSKMHTWYINQIFRIDFFNRKTKFNTLFHHFLNKLVNPFHYISYIKSHYCKKYKDDAFYK
jgi:glycosyltransferase involved in cell wall biosynthesis